MTTIGEGIGEGAIMGAQATRAAMPRSTPGGAAPAPQPGASAPRGRIEVSPQAIATVAGRAVADSYGVVGIAARHPRLATVELLPPESYHRGVYVRFMRDHIIIDLYVVLEHGLRITTIAHNIMANVKFAVERTLGLRVVRVNVNVQALRISRPGT